MWGGGGVHPEKVKQANGRGQNIQSLEAVQFRDSGWESLVPESQLRKSTSKTDWLLWVVDSRSSSNPPERGWKTGIIIADC